MNALQPRRVNRADQCSVLLGEQSTRVACPHWRMSPWDWNADGALPRCSHNHPIPSVPTVQFSYLGVSRKLRSVAEHSNSFESVQWGYKEQGRQTHRILCKSVGVSLLYWKSPEFGNRVTDPVCVKNVILWQLNSIAAMLMKYVNWVVMRKFIEGVEMKVHKCTLTF